MRKCIRQQLPLPQHNYSISSPPGQTLTAGLISILSSLYTTAALFISLFFLFFFVLLFFVVFNKNILQCLEQHLEERLSLYFVSSL